MSKRTRAPRVCSRQGCVALIYDSSSLCLQHQRQARRQRDATRDRTKGQHYDTKWRKLRGAYIKKHPHCVICGGLAHHVDHIVSIEQGGNKYDWRNLQSLCRSHHSQKTASQDGGFGNRKKTS